MDGYCGFCGIHNFKNLTVWQKSIELTTEIYSVTKSFPSDEKYGLTSQIRRAAVSVPSNIAEGAGRKSNKEFKYFLSLSTGSIFELETQIIVAHRLNLIDEKIINEVSYKIFEIQRMLYSLEKSIKI
ncbi:MAG: four helix bundle protein [Daejeonella sp.]